MAAKKPTSSKAKRGSSPQADVQAGKVLKTGDVFVVCHGKPKPGQKPTIKRLRRGRCIKILAVGGPGGSSKSPNG
jgi:hypothetical protein